jgi:hypothetical protein
MPASPNLRSEQLLCWGVIHILVIDAVLERRTLPAGQLHALHPGWCDQHSEKWVRWGCQDRGWLPAYRVTAAESPPDYQNVNRTRLRAGL